MKKLVCSMFLAFGVANSVFAMDGAAAPVPGVAGAPAERSLCTISVNSEDYIAAIAQQFGAGAAIQNDPNEVRNILPLCMEMGIHPFWNLVNLAPHGLRISRYNGEEANKFSILLTLPAGTTFDSDTRVSANPFFKALSGGRLDVHATPFIHNFTISFGGLSQILQRLNPDELLIGDNIEEQACVRLRLKSNF